MSSESGSSSPDSTAASSVASRRRTSAAALNQASFELPAASSDVLSSAGHGTTTGPGLEMWLARLLLARCREARCRLEVQLPSCPQGYPRKAALGAWLLTWSLQLRGAQCTL